MCSKRGDLNFFVFRKISKLKNIITIAMDATTKAIALLDCIAFYMHLEMGLIYFQIQQKDCV